MEKAQRREVYVLTPEEIERLGLTADQVEIYNVLDENGINICELEGETS